MTKKSPFQNKACRHSYLAIVRYFFRSNNVKQIKGEDFFTEGKYQEFKSRIEGLKDGTSPKWGTMHVDQMLRHLNLAIGSGQGIYNLPNKSSLLSRTLVKWILINRLSEQPRGLGLPLCLAVPAHERFDFETERLKLLALLDIATTAEAQSQWKPHCYFGKLSVAEWGKFCIMHLDYHLRQFGA